MKFVLSFFLLVFAARSRAAEGRFVRMPAVLSNNMVLQQKSNVPFWGKALPGDSVAVKASWGSAADTVVKSDSSWEVHVRTTEAGGPFRVTIVVGDSTIIYRNVMLGEVWLCSGQSNMQIPLRGWPPTYPLNNAAKEVREARYPDIRLFNVARSFSAAPAFDCVGKWTECTPKTAAYFSAVGYYFGRKLYRELHIPIGLIASSWGGTKIQPWISGRYLSHLAPYKPAVEKVHAIRKKFDSQLRWMRTHPVVNVENKSPRTRWRDLDFGDSACSAGNFDDSSWKTMQLPAHWSSTSVGVFYGVVWFRKTVPIPKSWLHSSITMGLGDIADMDEVWVNGVKIGEHFGGGLWATPRSYRVPGGIVNDTAVTIAIRVIANGGGGGILGGRGRMKLRVAGKTGTVSLAGSWRYMPVAEYRGRKFYVYGIHGGFYSRPRLPMAVGQNTPTVLFNGMIAPLIPYRIKGVVWYQGESNSESRSDYSNYGRLFPLLIRNWRADWHEGNFPFYWVQIAPWPYGKKAKSYVVRDAQRRTLSLPNTGMAVTLDIGSLTSIHPPDKRDVGRRLALWALAKAYGKHLVYSGPLYKSMEVKNGKAIISFKYVDGGLVIKTRNGSTNFIIAGRDSVFVKASVKISGNRLVVYSPNVKQPVAVRYAWGNAEQATLFNAAGLPASTFRTDNWRQ